MAALQEIEAIERMGDAIERAETESDFVRRMALFHEFGFPAPDEIDPEAGEGVDVLDIESVFDGAVQGRFRIGCGVWAMRIVPPAVPDKIAD